MKATLVLNHPAFREAAAGTAGALLALPLLSLPFIWDQAVFSTIADSMLRGGVVYRDAWEHKPPFGFYVYLATFLLVARKVWAVHLMELLAIGIASAGLLRYGERRFGSRVGGVVAALALPLLYLQVGTNSAQPESFQIPFVVWGLALWPRSSDAERLASRCFSSGLLLSAAVLFKTPAIVVPVVVLLDRLFIDRHREGWREKLRLTGVAAAGMAVLPAMVMAYYACRGAFGPLMDAWIYFPAGYADFGSNKSAQGHWVSAAKLVGWLLPIPALPLILLGIVRGILLRRGEAQRWAAFALTGWGIVAIQAKYFDYHHYPVIPFLALGMAQAFVADPDPASGRVRTWMNVGSLGAAGVLAGLTFGLYAIAVAPVWSRVGRLSDTEPPAVSAEQALRGQDATSVAQWIRASTQRDDSIFVWGDDPMIYFLSARPMAGPYCHLLAVIPPWCGKERLDALLDRFSRTPPRVVIVSPGKPWFRDREPVLLLDVFPEMRDLLRDRYELVHRIGGYHVWLRTD